MILYGIILYYINKPHKARAYLLSPQRASKLVFSLGYDPRRHESKSPIGAASKTLRLQVHE